MWAIMDSSWYLCMTTPTIKLHDLSSYKEIITCKSCSYVDPKYLHPQWHSLGGYKYISSSEKGIGFLITALNPRNYNHNISAEFIVPL